jgi:2,4-dienoyl-CoA reductase-like NADH-dependent reductase (Old Yellow Enzyme family)
MPDPLFEGLMLRGLRLRNRIALSPMCQYSAVDGLPGDWHFRHYAERAVGGAGLVMVEATAVLPEGRITPYDLGIWNDEQAEVFGRLVERLHGLGAVVGIQLAHAGRKASTEAPWRGGRPIPAAGGGWTPVSAGALPFGEGYPEPLALDEGGLARVEEAFVAASARALRAGFDLLELHAAHGYLLHQFLSPLSNRREDGWGGGEGGRFRLCLETAAALRAAWPAEKPMVVRISACDWVEGGWDLAGSTRLLLALRDIGIDLVDVSSGGLTPAQKIPLGPCYQVPLSEALRRDTGMPTGAVGLITTAEEARSIIETGKADLVSLGRLLLRDPYWPLRTSPPEARRVPEQYLRAFA